MEMMSMSERAIGDDPTLDDVDERSIADVAPEAPPEDFDMEAWVKGIRAPRRAIKLRANGHLLAELDRLEAEIDTTPDGPEVEELIHRFEQLRTQYENGLWVTVEKRSDEWLRGQRKRLVKQLGLQVNAKDDAVKASAIRELGLHLVVIRVVEPRMTADDLRSLYDHSEGEAAKLTDLVNRLHNQPDKSGALSRDFSSRLSGSRRTSG